MNRRNFLWRLVTGTAAVAVAPTVLEGGIPPFNVEDGLMCSVKSSAVIDGYNDYCNFSSFAQQCAIDEAVQNCAVELGRRAGQSVGEVWRATFDA